MIVKTDAIVLKTIDYSESSIIATLFTREKGKTAVIAKGARKPKSKFAAFLVPGQLLEVVYYSKQSRSVQTLSDISYLQKLPSLRFEMEKMAFMMTTIEQVDQILHDNEVNTDLFSFLENVLTWADSRTDLSPNLFPYIQIRLADHVGVGIQLLEDALEASYGYLNIDSGTVSSTTHGDHARKLTPKQFAFVKKSLHSTNASVLQIVMDNRELKNLIETLDNYFTYHIEGIKPRKSDKIFDQLLMK
ncbi:MAG: DNA repair protein RecO [Bacteroidetes bacterium]|jgi:DNA repair protein RecO (recombination protein O)|nr:DNA repair protein RecO [Bacteroidota bacterium]